MGCGGQVRQRVEHDDGVAELVVAITGGRGAVATYTAVAGWPTGADVFAGRAGAGLVAGAGIGLVVVSHLILLGLGPSDPSLALMRRSALERKS